MTIIGMSAPASEWSLRYGQAGPVYARRIFGALDSPSAAYSLAKSEVAAKRLPVVSFKIPNNDWAGVAAGHYDTALRSVGATLGGLGAKVFVTLHHEPQGDGTASDWSKMLAHGLPVVKGGRANLLVGPIANGFWWSNQSQGLTDAQIATWLPSTVRSVSDVIAADCYQGGTNASPGEGAGPKIANMSKWATRVGGVKGLGVGEFNGLDATSITAAGKAILADKRFVFACCFNSSVNNRTGVDWVLSGARLTAFKNIVTASRTTSTSTFTSTVNKTY